MGKKQDETVWLYEIQKKHYMSEAQKIYERELKKADRTEDIRLFSGNIRIC